MIRTGAEGPVALVFMSRPERRNALTPKMLAAFAAACVKAGASAGAVIVAGDGPIFCAGFDLELCAADPGGGVMTSLLRGLSETIRALRELPCPVVAAVQGGAIAGGCALLGGCDFVVSDEEAKLGYPVTRLGVSPAVSAPFLRLSSSDGWCRAMQLDPGLISGAEACRRGLVDACVPEAGMVLDRARGVAAAVARHPRHGVRATRRWLLEVERSAAEDEAERALATSLGLAGGAEERERLGLALRKG